MKYEITSVSDSNRPRGIYVLLAGWFLLNFFSATFTELSYDEAYYWMYSRFPSYGYFDHPPMVAWMNVPGSALLPGEAGVRLLTVFGSCVTLWLLYKLINPATTGTFALLVLSVFPFQLFGFMSVPDVPLLLFGTLFFYSYRQFLRQDTNFYTLLLALSMAGLMYSKYHGIIFMMATLVSNPALIKNRKILVAIFFSLLLYLPHLWWQYQHDFITFWFHLAGRFAGPYQLGYTAEYVMTQILFYGPVTGILLLYCAWRYKTADRFEKALRYTFFGTFLFFLLSTYKGRIEANWTIPALIPMTYLAIRYMEEKPFLLKWLKLSAALSIPLFIAARLVLVFSEEAYFHRMGELVGWRTYTQALIRQTGDLPLVANTYQEAAKLSFYSGKIIPSLNLNGRRNQYDLWDLAHTYQGKKVYFLSDYQKQGIPMINPKKDTSHLTLIDPLVSCQGLKIEAEDHRIRKNSRVEVPLNIKTVSGRYPASLASTATIRYTFYEKRTAKIIKQEETEILPLRDEKGNWSAVAQITSPGESGTYRVTFSFYAPVQGDWGSWKGSTFTVE
jgi:4-amino-4-deoxy-L-arabinose transferase-like glycosyltransferase